MRLTLFGHCELVSCRDDATACAMKTSADTPRPTVRSRADGTLGNTREDLASVDGRRHSAGARMRFDGRRKHSADAQKPLGLLARPFELHGGLGAGRRTELRSRIREVTRHRVRTQVEPLGDLTVR